MSYDCCGDGRIVGDSLGAALHTALRLIHENLQGFLINSEQSTWLFLSIVTASSLMLAIGLSATRRYHVVSKITRLQK